MLFYLQMMFSILPQLILYGPGLSRPTFILDGSIIHSSIAFEFVSIYWLKVFNWHSALSHFIDNV